MRKNRVLILILLLKILLVEENCLANVDQYPELAPNTNSSSFSKYYSSHLKPTFTDGFDQTGFIILGLGGVLGIVAHQYDKKMAKFFTEKERLGPTLTDFGNSFGTRYLNVVVAGTQMIWDRSNGLAHLEALLGTTVMVTAIKKSVNRTRPNGENQDSFPSGHTSAAFASSASLAYAYGWKAAIPAYALTSLTFMARMEDNKHWFSDLVVATSIGIFWARASGIHHNYLSPIILKEGGGVEFSYNF